MKEISLTTKEHKFLVSFLERRQMYRPYNNGVWEDWMDDLLNKLNETN